MNPPRLLLSTCGTSILTNGADEDTRRWLVRVTNQPVLKGEDEMRLRELTAARKGRIQKSDVAERRRLSAEINGICAVLKRWPSDRVLHLLVHTDTAAGRAAAEIVASCVPQANFLTASGLRTDDDHSLREALADLTSQIEQWVKGYEGSVVFNLTGGFKSVNGYLQALGMLYADRCVFLYENSAQLMEIPRLPVQLAEIEVVRKHLLFFRRVAMGYPVSASEANGIPESLVLEDSDLATTSLWGDIVWRRYRANLLGEGLLEPLSARLVVTGDVRREVKSLARERRVEVNEALDALAAYLDHGRAILKSNTFKPLEGQPSPPATHEMYLWSDGAAGRLLGHFDGERFLCDRIRTHL